MLPARLFTIELLYLQMYTNDQMWAASLYSVLWQCVTAFVICCAWRGSGRLDAGCSLSGRILHTSVMAVALILIGLMFVGSIGFLDSIFSLVGVAAVSLAWERLSTSSFFDAIPCSEQTKPSQATIQSQRWVLSTRPALNIRVKIIWWFIGSLLAGHIISNGLLGWPTDWDSLMYHMPFVDHWIQERSLFARGSARWSMPASSELIALWFAVSFSGDFLVPLNNLPALIVFTAAILQMGETANFSPFEGCTCASICIFTQVTLRQSVDASNDLIVAAFFFSGMHYLGKIIEGHRPVDGILFGISVGVLTGIKYFAVGYALLLIGLFAVLAFRSDRSALQHFRSLCYFFLGAGLLGSFWYVRNYFATGNPLYPLFSRDFSERMSYPGIHRTTLLFHLSWDAMEKVFNSVWNRCGVFHVASVAVAPSVVIKGIGVYRSSPERCRFQWAIAYLGVLAILLATPMLVEDQPGTLNQLKWGYTTVRYGLCFWTFNVFLAFIAASRFRRQIGLMPMNLRCAIGVAAMTLQIYWTSIHLRPLCFEPVSSWTILCGVLLLTLYVLCRIKCGRYVLVISVVGLLIQSVLIAYLSFRWHAGLAKHFDEHEGTTVFCTIEESVERILVLDDRSYPFFGSHRQNYIVQPMRFHDADRSVQMCIENQLTLVATRIENGKEIARYRPAWYDLENDDRFKPYPLQLLGNYRLFRPKVENLPLLVPGGY